MTIKTNQMKKITSLLIALLISSVSIQAQKLIKGNGNIITKSRSVGDFDNIALAGHFDVTLKKGNEGEITIKAEENLMEYIETKVDDGKLKIKMKKNFRFRSTKSIHLTIAFSEFNGVAVSGSGNVQSEALIKANEFGIALSGSGGMNLNISAQHVKSAISGSGNISLEGETDSFTCAVSGSGNVNCYELKAQNVNAKVSGSGNIKVYASNSIEAHSSGSGNIYYKGNPKTEKAKSSGSGSVKSKE